MSLCTPSRTTLYGNVKLRTDMAAPLTVNYEFVDSIPEDYYCKKCSLVARRLTVTSCCGEHYCHACIANTQQQDEPCPECGEESFNFLDLVKYQKRIASLKVYCSLKESGCDWSGTLEQLEAHLDPDLYNCQYVDTKCPLNCQQAIHKNKVEQHVRKECVKREHVCQHCNFKATYEEVVEKHLAECKYVPLQCPNFCGVTCEREVMEDHMKICPLEIITCEFLDMGCGELFKREDQKEHTVHFSQSHLSLLACSLTMNFQEQKLFQDKMFKQEEKFQQKFQEQGEVIHEQDDKLVNLEKKLKEQEQNFQDQKLAHEKTISFASKLEKQQQTLQEKIALLEKTQNELKFVVDRTITKVSMMTRLYRNSFVLENFSSKKEGSSEEWVRGNMYTFSGGYKFRIRIHPNGQGVSLGKAVNIDVFPTPGEYDERLEWPVEAQYTVEMLNCTGGNNWIVTSNTGRWGKNRRSYLLSINYSEKQNCYIEHYKLHDYFCDDSLYFKISCWVFD